MKVSKRRWLASALLKCAEWVTPGNRSDWVRAMSAELPEISSDSEALKFAAGCVWAAIAIAEEADTDYQPNRRNRVHNSINALARNPRSTGVVCGLTSAALGLAYLMMSDAPLQYIIVNLCATAMGVAFFFAMNNSGKRDARISPLVWFGLAVLLLLTTSFGLRVEGASRWLRVGSLTLQPSLILVPVMLIAYTQRQTLVAAVSIIAVAFALALQPDRAMAAVLASGTILIATMARDWRTTTVALCAMASFGVTMNRADTLPAVPHVDRILVTAFNVNMGAGCAVILGASLLFLPAFLARSSSRRETHAYTVFGAIWLAIVAAAAIGNYPTPVVGYGGSAILGYFVSIAFLPAPLASVGTAEAETFYNRDERDDESQLLEILRGHLVTSSWLVTSQIRQ